MKPLIVFGTQEFAELASFYFANDSSRNIAAFTVDAAFLKENTFQGQPVVPFEEIERKYPPDAYDAFVAVGYNQLNLLRRDKYLALKQKGYALASYVSSKATIWPKIEGENCFILEDNTVQPFARIGHNVTLWSGNHIGHHSVIGDHCFITSHVVVSGKTTVGEGSFIGVNVTLRDHIKVGKYCVIGAGAQVMKDTPDYAVYRGQVAQPADIDSRKLKKI